MFLARLQEEKPALPPPAGAIATPGACRMTSTLRPLQKGARDGLAQDVKIQTATSPMQRLNLQRTISIHGVEVNGLSAVL